MDETDLFEGISRLRRESATDLGVAAPSSNRRAIDGAEFPRSQSDGRVSFRALVALVNAFIE